LVSKVKFAAWKYVGPTQYAGSLVSP